MSSTVDRVRELIARMGVTDREFAQRTGLDDTKLSESLGGTRRFSSLDLARIAESSEVSVDWLLTGEESALAVAARGTGGNAKTALTHADDLTKFRSGLAELGYPQPWRPVQADVTTGTWQQQGERLAAASIAHIGDAAAPAADIELPALIEDAFGADVAIVELDEGFDGLAASSQEAKLIVAATSQVPMRQRFTLAHELGHLLAGDAQDIHLDEDIYDAAVRRRPSEQRANAFASAFLMPAAVVRAAVEDRIDEGRFAGLACDLKVSPNALAYRMKDLRLIDAGTCERYRNLSMREAAALAGRADELAAQITEAGRPRYPHILARDAYRAYENGLTTLHLYEQIIGEDAEDLLDTPDAGSEAEQS